MKSIFKVLMFAVLISLSVAGCDVPDKNSNVANIPAYEIIDKFTGPDGEITLLCRKGDLFVNKDGYRSGNIEFHYKHEKCAGK